MARDKCFVVNSNNRGQLQIATELGNRSKVVSQQTRACEDESRVTAASDSGTTYPEKVANSIYQASTQK